MGCCSSGGTERLVRVKGKMNAAIYRHILDEKGRRFIFQQDNDPQPTAEATKEWLRADSVNILESPCQSPGLNLTEYLWRVLKLTVHRRSLSYLTENCPKIGAKLVALHSKRLEAVIPAKDASTKYSSKDVNTFFPERLNT